MKTSDRQKMCSNCDGRISYEATICPYCGTEQAPLEPESQMPLFKNQSLQDSLTTLYSPPYSQKNSSFQEEPAPVKKKPEIFKEVKSTFSTNSGNPMPINETENSSTAGSKQNPIVPLLILSLGSNLFILGLIQFFFSKEGFLNLQWDASFWFIYTLISLPLLYLGYKKATKFT
jgi:hypothetical protein